MKEDTIKPLSSALINYKQRLVGKFLYLGRNIDHTTLYALNEIAIATTKGTEATLAAVEHFLNYMTSNPSPKLQFLLDCNRFWLQPSPNEILNRSSHENAELIRNKE